MESASSPLSVPGRELAGEKVERIVDAMRASVAARGTTASTFDHVAREAGVSRGLLHYYFGTKERLLVEVVRREMDLSEARLDKGLAGAANADEVLMALVGSYEDYLGEGDSVVALFFELMTLARRNDEIATQLAELSRRTRGHLAELLRAKHEAGIVQLSTTPDAVATCLIALADGLSVRYLTEPEVDMAEALATAVLAARSLLS